MAFPVIHSRADILQMLDELATGRREMLAACDKLSPEKRRDPVVPSTWSVLKNLTHLAWAEAYMLAWIKKRPAALPKAEFPPEPAEDLAAIRTVFDEAHAEAIAFLKSNPDSVLAEPCVYGRDVTAQSVGGVFFHLVEHEIGHRAVVRFKLRMLGG
jgi:uncharacterized damage-inducible protein DinB